MRRIALLMALLALVGVACAPAAPLPPLPEAGCYSVVVPGGWGSMYFTGVAPTPSNPYNFRNYVNNSDCSPSALTGQSIGVNALNGVDAAVKCLEQAGILAYPTVTAATIYRQFSGFNNIWMCSSVI